MTTIAQVHEIPLPPPEKPKREPERRPEYERPTVTIGAASVWVADLQRSAADFVRRHGGAAVVLTIELDDGRRLDARDVRPGPGDGFVTFLVAGDEDERELGLRLDRVAGIELAAAKDDAEAFRLRRVDVGFGRVP
jgi:hypothetical protein